MSEATKKKKKETIHFLFFFFSALLNTNALVTGEEYQICSRREAASGVDYISGPGDRGYLGRESQVDEAGVFHEINQCGEGPEDGKAPAGKRAPP
jgi:hypothetical protein